MRVTGKLAAQVAVRTGAVVVVGAREWWRGGKFGVMDVVNGASEEH